MGALGATAMPVNDERNRVTGIIDKQFVAAQVRLPHRDGKALLPSSIQLTITAITITIRIDLDVFVPEYLQADMLALQLVVHGRPVGLSPPPEALLCTRGTIETSLKIRVAQVQGQRP
jgi:hypothetical protein